MKSKKVIIVAMVFVMMMSLGGCDKGQMTPAQMQALGENVKSLTEQLTMYQAQVTALGEEMQKTGIVDANDTSKLAKLNAQIDKVKPQLAAAADALIKGNYDPNDDMLINILKAVRDVNSTTGTFNPYAGLIGMALTAVIAILGLFAKKKSTEAATKTQALNEVVMGAESFKLTATPEEWAKFKAAQTANQSEVTKKEVQVITA